jgi:hypothetical protein
MPENDIEKREKTRKIAIERLSPGFVKSPREQVDEPLLIIKTHSSWSRTNTEFLEWRKHLPDCMEKKSALSGRTGRR